MIKKILLVTVIAVLFCSCKNTEATVYKISGENGKKNIISYGVINCNDIITASIPDNCSNYNIIYKLGQSVEQGQTIAEYTLNGVTNTLSAKHNGIICDEQKLKKNELDITYYNLDDVNVITQVSESDIKYVEIGDKVAIKGEGLEKNYYSGTVTGLSSSAKSSDNGTFIDCVIHFDQPDLSIIPGFTVKIESEVDIDNSVSIPIDAIKFDENGYYVTMVTKSKLQKKYINEILFNNGEYTVCTGLNSGDTLLIESD